MGKGKRPDDLTIKIVEKAIGIPAQKWHGKCFEISCRIVRAKLVNGVAVYGHYRGSVATTGFWAERRGQLFQRHGWIVLDEANDGRYLDPTLWSFEDKEPYLHIHDCSLHEYLCTCDHVTDEHESGFLSACTICGCCSYENKKCDYDEGGNMLRETMLMPPPPFSKEDPVEELPVRGDAKGFVMTALGNPKAITRPMLFWLANLPVRKLGPYAPDVYKALIEHGDDALIPIDNRRMVLGTYG
jgi:hypothetical protein